MSASQKISNGLDKIHHLSLILYFYLMLHWCYHKYHFIPQYVIDVPLKKNSIVKSVKSQTDQLTLAIGDGLNDVNMIIAADVGIGIRGK